MTSFVGMSYKNPFFMILCNTFCSSGGEMKCNSRVDCKETFMIILKDISKISS